MGLLDSSAEEPKSKVLRWSVSGLLLLVLAGFVAWYLLRFQTEKNTASHFLQALAADDVRRAYELWKPGTGYPYELFLEDWGPSSEYGPVRSFRIVAAEQPRSASGVIIVVEVSPQAPFDGSNPGIKEVRLWVERKDQSLTFAP